MVECGACGFSSGLGVAASAVGGHLADRISARGILIVCMTLDGLALIGYAFADGFVSALLIAAVVGILEAAGAAARMAIIARAFDGPRRVSARAILRTVTNVAPGAYQGVFSMGFNLGAMLAPVVVTAAIGQGALGWGLLATLFVTAAFGTTAIAWRSAPRVTV